MRQSLSGDEHSPAGSTGDTPSRSAPPSRLAGALERFRAVLEKHDLRLTRERIAILEAALEMRGHFPIEQLVAELRRRGVRGSKATVYRVLPLLTEAGILQAADFSNDTRRYEAAFGREHHDHLVCRGCGRVVEFEYEAFEVLQREVAARHGFELEGHVHQLVGRCPACRELARDETMSQRGEEAADDA